MFNKCFIILTNSSERPSNVQAHPEAVPLYDVGGNDAEGDAEAVGHGRDQVHPVPVLVVVFGGHLNKVSVSRNCPN
jgi:hypothetical protein